MQSSRRRVFSIFSLVFVLLGVTGINVTGAATKAKLTAPSAPYSPKFQINGTTVTVTWMAPKSNGGSPITSYKITAYPGKKVDVCRSSRLSCIVKMVNPNKPSTKPVGVIFYVTVIASNAIGSSPESERSGKFSITFYPSTYIPPKSGPATTFPTPTPTPTPTLTPTPTPIPDSSPTFTPAYVTNAFDGSYVGNATVTTKSALSPNGSTSTIPTSFVIYAGRGSGRALNWSVDGYITDPAGQASVTVADSMYGSMTFAVSFTQDPTTKAIAGNGHGTKTFAVVGFGDVTVDFVFSVTNKK